jgi:hypothetical protein
MSDVQQSGREVKVELNLGVIPGDDEHGPVTMGELVARSVAQELIQRDSYGRRLHLDDDHCLVNEIRKAAVTVIEEELRPRVQAMLDDAINAAIQPTSDYGEPKGEARTLREIIVERAVKALREPSRTSRSSSYPSGLGESLIDAVIGDQLDAAWQRELLAAVRDAKAEAVAAVQARAAGVLADTIVGMAEEKAKG